MNISSTLFAKTLKQKFLDNNEEFYDGGLGENPLPQPQCLIDTVIEHSHLKEYTSAKGVLELQKLLGNNIIVGNGLKPLLFTIQLTFHKLYPDGIIYHLVPFWVSYEEQTKILGVKNQRIVPEDKVNWKITANDLRKNLAKNEKSLIIFNNPNNPSGCIYSKKEVESLAKVLNEYDCIVIADDIYEKVVHKDVDFGQIKNYYEKTISGSSLSKMVSCGGYRLGWLIFPECLKELYETMNIIASSLYSCPSVMFQYVAIKTLKFEDEIKKYLAIQQDFYTKIKEFVIQELKKTKIIFSESNGGWYILLNFDNYKEQLRKIGICNSHQLSKYLIDEFKIIMVAGQNFGIEEHLTLRYSYIDIQEIDMENEDFNLEKISILLYLLQNWLNKIN